MTKRRPGAILSTVLSAPSPEKGGPFQPALPRARSLLSWRRLSLVMNYPAMRSICDTRTARCRGARFTSSSLDSVPSKFGPRVILFP
jgi:hypothetical protein